MGEYIKEGEMVEGMKCSIYTRKIEFKKGGLRKDPITNKNMVLYELDRNCSVEVTESMLLLEEEKQKRINLKVHGDVGDKIKGDAIRLYADSKRDSLKPIVKEGQTGRHGASLINTNIRTIGKIKTPFDVYKRLLGYSPHSDNTKIEV
ncbi:hypothetical protein [Phocaeicola coprophilus]|jgi:hypothetical protein|uniref:hypothetical protein n=1 Tax=Phocaeicola coprophilus TaxID=387090 RepID=UPI00207119D2|nr:hypothetical protein [Phocaeicola coprophilus]DAQ11081.1 MAG TPA: hypothetical protein [Caudoviricetes sp.]